MADMDCRAESEQSGAIIQYLVDQYDKNNDISYGTIVEKYQTQQWLAFQISGKRSRTSWYSQADSA
jgi:glutathione S-transferase